MNIFHLTVCRCRYIEVSTVLIRWKEESGTRSSTRDMRDIVVHDANTKYNNNNNLERFEQAGRRQQFSSIFKIMYIRTYKTADVSIYLFGPLCRIEMEMSGAVQNVSIFNRFDVR